MTIIKEQTVAFTGNRDLTTSTGRPDANLENVIRTELSFILEDCYRDGKLNYLSGMAVGWDMICGEEVLKLRAKCPEVKLIAVVPFKGQETKFSQSEKRRYHNLLNEADETIVIWKDDYDPAAYHKRNDFLVENASEFIAYHNGKPRSGTGSTINKARKAGIEVHNLYDELLDYFNITHPAKRFLQRYPYTTSFRYSREGIIISANDEILPISFTQIEHIDLCKGYIHIILNSGVELFASPISDEVKIKMPNDNSTLLN
ncbi:MAG: SLOG family protein [Rikenellaceae bacterium]